MPDNNKKMFSDKIPEGITPNQPVINPQVNSNTALKEKPSIPADLPPLAKANISLDRSKTKDNPEAKSNKENIEQTKKSIPKPPKLTANIPEHIKDLPFFERIVTPEMSMLINQTRIYENVNKSLLPIKAIPRAIDFLEFMNTVKRPGVYAIICRGEKGQIVARDMHFTITQEILDDYYVKPESEKTESNDFTKSDIIKFFQSQIADLKKELTQVKQQQIYQPQPQPQQNSFEQQLLLTVLGSGSGNLDLMKMRKLEDDAFKRGEIFGYEKGKYEAFKEARERAEAEFADEYETIEFEKEQIENAKKILRKKASEIESRMKQPDSIMITDPKTNVVSIKPPVQDVGNDLQGFIDEMLNGKPQPDEDFPDEDEETKDLSDEFVDDDEDEDEDDEEFDEEDESESEEEEIEDGKPSL